MKVRMTDEALFLFAAAAIGAVIDRRDEEQRTIDSSGPPKGVLSGPLHAEPVPDFSSMSRQRRRYEERKWRKQRA